nr:DUF4412 domain-containing protein [candidate division Zixibacteria bacterium]
MKLKGWVIAVMATLLLVGPALVSADTMIKQVNERGAFEMMGQKVPAGSDTSTVWLGKDRARTDNGDTATVIMRMDKNAVYMIDHKHKAYTEIALEDLGDFDKMMGDNEEAKKMMQGMMAMMKMTVTVTPTEETQKIDKWNCKKYDVKVAMGMGSSDMVIWATDEVKLDYDMFMNLTNSFKAIMPGYDQMIEEMKKIKGLPIKTLNTTKMMGAEATSVMQVIDIKEMDPPAGIYELPEGYQKSDIAMPGMGGK